MKKYTMKTTASDKSPARYEVAPGVMSNLAPAVRVSQIEEQIKCLEGAIQRMEKATHTITERISSVVTYVPVEENASVVAPEPMLVPLASDLRNYVRELNGIAARLEDVGSRVEL